MEDISGNTHVLFAVRGEIYWKSQDEINWSGFFGEGDSDELIANNIVGYKEISDHGYRGIYKGDCIKGRVALTATQIFCADTNEVCCFLFFMFVFESREINCDFQSGKVKSETCLFITPSCQRVKRFNPMYYSLQAANCNGEESFTTWQVNLTPVYHVEKPHPFISPLTLYGYIYRKLQNFSKIP